MERKSAYAPRMNKQPLIGSSSGRPKPSEQWVSPSAFHGRSGVSRSRGRSVRGGSGRGLRRSYLSFGPGRPRCLLRSPLFRRASLLRASHLLIIALLAVLLACEAPPPESMVAGASEQTARRADQSQLEALNFMQTSWPRHGLLKCASASGTRSLPARNHRQHRPSLAASGNSPLPRRSTTARRTGARSRQGVCRGLAKYPNNGWSLYGLAQAQRKLGDSAAAADSEHRFAAAWQWADVQLASSRF